MTLQEDVACRIYRSFQRLCGGGIQQCPTCNCHSSSNLHIPNVHDTDVGANNSEWLSHLKALAEKSISYPNGKIMEIEANGSSKLQRDTVNIGKPHNVETRLALSFFHRYRHKCQRVVATIQEDACNESDGRFHTIPKLSIISDMGLVRSVQTPAELATLLVRDMEDALWYERNITKGGEESNGEGPYESNGQFSSAQQNYHIKAHESGIIFIVTPNRVEFLRSIGRLPCSHCTKWVRGEKGLWWHEQREHNIDHSAAMAIASSSIGVHERSIVIYIGKRDRSGSGDQHEQRDNNEDRTGTCNRMKLQKKNDLDTVSKKGNNIDLYFEHIKNGDLQEFISYLEHNSACGSSGQIDVSLYLDKNGASALHWAAGCGHLHIVQYLIEDKRHQCPPDQPQKGKRSFRNRTPLHWSARNGHLDVVRYLVEKCEVDIDASTIDGTTAFCWSCWQGHEKVMRYLHQKGADTDAKNSFGCNAALWSSQSNVSSLDTIKWLQSIGVYMGLVNSNGHSMLHKSAQRGKEDVCKWIFATFTCDVETSLFSAPQEYSESIQDPHLSGNFVDMIKLISPDAESCCPSDLAGMEGFEDLARWLACQERSLARQAITSNSCPPWLKDGLEESRHLSNRSGLDGIYEKGAGVKKMCSHLRELGIMKI